MPLPRPLLALDVLTGVVGVALVAASVLHPSGSAAAVGGPADGSDWGASGQLASDSAVTATWTNDGNVATSRVPRTGTEVLPHTAAKTYADISASDRSAYDSYFGSGNGLGGLKVSVSQTRDLVNQSVSVDVSGAKANIQNGRTDSTSYFQIFQCWGAPGSDGKPDSAATAPDPATCQMGAGAPDSVGVSTPREQRQVAGDPLVPGGDWEPYNGFTPRVDVPFRAIDGTVSGSTSNNKNTFYNRTTTNELEHATVTASGAATRQVEVQTGQEAQGLGCGARSDQASTSTCWLVVVPRIDGVNEGLGPIAPTVWAQRLQFQLDFQPASLTCPGGRARSLTVGSEMLAAAARSWVPGICDSSGVALGYTRLGDEQARNQFIAGTNDAVLTSRPVPASTPSIPVPVALTAPVIAYNFDYHPECTVVDPNKPLDITNVTTEANAKKCGYADLAALKADLAKANKPVRDLNLNARLVAKLLTMSYQAALIGCLGSCQYYISQGWLPTWTAQRPATLTGDPEFRRLNPQLHLSPNSDIGQMILESVRSDAAAEVWSWILSDPQAAGFLSGCPDADGVVVNPFFSTRTYTGCTAQATDLAAKADAARAAVANLSADSPVDQPTGFLDLPATYPPDGLAYPLPQWQELKPTTIPFTSPPQIATTTQTLVDIQPRVDSMQVAARDAFIGYRPRNSDFCSTAGDPVGCAPAPGKWRDLKIPQTYGLRQIFTISDASSAARYQLPTASLCATTDTTGADCVGADSASLRTAAGAFIDSTVPGFQQPGAAAYADGAYPLTLPVYAAIDPTASNAERASYFSALAYVVGDGQTPGYAAGSLPPGYAPVTDDMAQVGLAALGALRIQAPEAAVAAVAGAVAAIAGTKSPTAATPVKTTAKAGKSSPSPSADATATAADDSGSAAAGPADGAGVAPAPGAAVPSDVAAPSGAPATTAAAPAADETVQTVAVAASTESWPGWVLPLGLGLALGAGVAGPFLRRRTNVKLR